MKSTKVQQKGASNAIVRNPAALERVGFYMNSEKGLQLKENGKYAGGAEAQETEDSEEHGDEASDDSQAFRQEPDPPREGSVGVMLRLHLGLDRRCGSHDV